MIELILVVIMAVVVGISFITIACALDTDGAEFVNPLVIYRKMRVNWFGVVILTIIFNALTMPIALGYWFYKLCTVGRR